MSAVIEYTKGEWQLDNQTGNVTAEGYLVARVFGATVHNYEQNSAECYGNAKLITNAPTMFALLKEFACCQQDDIKLKAKEFLSQIEKTGDNNV